MNKNTLRTLLVVIAIVGATYKTEAADTATLAWGRNSDGLLLTGDASVQPIPVLLANTSFDGFGITSISAGNSHAAAVSAHGDVYTWGSNVRGQIGNHSLEATQTWSPMQVGLIGNSLGDPIVQVAASKDSVLALSAAGLLWSWGSNLHGILGNGTHIPTTGFTDVPVPVNITTHGTAKWIACSSGFCGAMTRNNVLLTWGTNGQGQLGTSTGVFGEITRPIAVNMTGFEAGRYFKSVSFGGSHVLALTDDGKAVAWGSNVDFQLGTNGSQSAQPWPVFVNVSDIPSGDAIVQVAAGAAHSLLLTDSGLIYGWGLTQFYQLMNTPEKVHMPLPYRLSTAFIWGKVTSIGACSDSSFAGAESGRFYGWGYAADYILGSNTTRNAFGPIKVNLDALPASNFAVTSLSSSGFSSTVFAIATEVVLPPYTQVPPSDTPTPSSEPPPFHIDPVPIPLAPTFSGGVPTAASNTLVPPHVTLLALIAALGFLLL